MDFQPGDRVEVSEYTFFYRKKFRVRRGHVCNVFPYFVLINFGPYKESFSFVDLEAGLAHIEVQRAG